MTGCDPTAQVWLFATGQFALMVAAVLLAAFVNAWSNGQPGPAVVDRRERVLGFALCFLLVFLGGLVVGVNG